MSAKLINIHQLSDVLGISNAAIYSHIARNNYSAIPPPIRLGRKLAWIDAEVTLWIESKMNKIKVQENLKEECANINKKIGRPSKSETVKRRRHSEQQ